MSDKPWSYDPERQEFVCVTCGYRHEQPGAVQLHAVKAHGWRGKARREREERQIYKQEGRQEGDGCSDHSWRLLRREVPAEGQAIASGYTRVCVNCEEVQK